MTNDLTTPWTGIDLECSTKGLTDEYSVERTNRPTVTLVVKREVVAPILLRNTADGQAEVQSFDGSYHAQANGEKFVSRERLTGLDFLRQMDRVEDDRDLIHDDYEYNNVESWNHALNLDPFSYGIVGAESYGDNFNLKSHVTEGYTYSTTPYNATNSEKRNAINETGTMKEFSPEESIPNDKFEQSTSLYTLSPVKPPNSFIHFVTIESGLPGMLLYVMHNILNTDVYGSRGSRTGRNIRNNIIGFIQSQHPISLSTGELMMMYRAEVDHDSGSNEGSSIISDVAAYIDDVQKGEWDVYLDGGTDTTHPDLPDWFSELVATASRSQSGSRDTLADIFTQTTETIRSDLHSESP